MSAVPPFFTILLPIIRPPVMLPFAIESVLAQSVHEFELLIICDGAPPETIACARDYAGRDTRIKVFPFPKGQRNGEAHRHVVLGSAAGRYIAQIADDDLWFPDHLAELTILLSQADFGNLLHVWIHPDGHIEMLPGDLGLPETRQRMLTEKFNSFGPTVAGYRLEAYRRLPEGWSPAPLDVWSDLHMWRKFLRMEGFTFATRAAVTAIVFATPHRPDATLQQRQDESRSYLERVRDPGRRNELVQGAWHSLLDQSLRNERQVLALSAARDNLAAELARASPLIAAKEDEINRALQSNRELAAELARTTALVAAQQGEIDRAHHSTGELATELSRMTALVAATQGEIDRAHQSNHDLTAELARTSALVAATEGEVDRILRSRSWRLTAPLRKSFAIARRLRGARPT